MSVTLHTDLGDLKVEVFCEAVPRAAENFLALCASGYYNGCAFHRNIKGFMVQTGDPTGTGKGGASIWGRKFEDEIKTTLRHNARGIVSMANNGPGTLCLFSPCIFAAASFRPPVEINRHEREPVLYHLRKAAQPGQQVHGLWQVGHVCEQRDVRSRKPYARARTLRIG